MGICGKELQELQSSGVTGGKYRSGKERELQDVNTYIAGDKKVIVSRSTSSIPFCNF